VCCTRRDVAGLPAHLLCRDARRLTRFMSCCNTESGSRAGARRTESCAADTCRTCTSDSMLTHTLETRAILRWTRCPGQIIYSRNSSFTWSLSELQSSDNKKAAAQLHSCAVRQQRARMRFSSVRSASLAHHHAHAHHLDGYTHACM